MKTMAKLTMKKYIFRFAILCLCIGLYGCTEKQDASVVEADISIVECVNNRRLNLSAVTEYPRIQELYHAEGDKKIHDTFLGIDAEIKILWNSEEVSLLELISTKEVSTHELLAYARLDAEAGFCEETTETESGFTLYAYTYPNYILYSIYDVFSSPTGKEYPVQMFMASKPDGHMFPGFFRPYILEMQNGVETRIELGEENWNLNFEDIQATNEGITFYCTQSGGQQAGQLYAEGYFLIRNGEILYHDLAENFSLTGKITMDGKTKLSCKWKRTLEPGDYILCIHIRDEYFPITPMQNKYNDIQNYNIPFSIAN